MNTENRISFACALGAFIGALLSLEIAARFEYGKYLWTIGAFIGGLVGYVSYQFKDIVFACREQENRQKLFVRICKVLGKTLGFLRVCGYIMIIVVVMSLNFMLLLSAVERSGSAPYTTAQHDIIVCIAFGIATSAAITVCLLMADEDRGRDTTLSGFTYYWVRHCNAFYLFWMVLCIMKWAIVRVPWLIRQCIEFAQGVFIKVHSDIRTICFVDSVLGATVGYFLGSALVGAIAGAFLGVVNYHLVSVCWLKLVPKA